MNAKVSVFVICVEATIYLLLYNLQDCTFNEMAAPMKKKFRPPTIQPGPQSYFFFLKIKKKNYYELIFNENQVIQTLCQKIIGTFYTFY